MVKALAKEFWQEEDGLQTIEMVLILVVIIGLAVTLQQYAHNWLDAINGQISDMIGKFPNSPSPTTN